MQPPAELWATVLVLAAAGSAAAAPAPLRVKVLGPRPVLVASPAPPASGVALYQERCACCHGERGRGDGPSAAGLMVKPRRFTDAFWQESETDAHLAKAILEGGFAVKRSSAMPPHPDLKGREPELVAVVRSFRSPTGSVAVQAVRESGEVIATFTAEADGMGVGEVELKELPPEAVALVGRVSGRADPVCRVPLGAGPPPRAALCSPELASTSEPAPPPAPPAPAPPPQEPR